MQDGQVHQTTAASGPPSPQHTYGCCPSLSTARRARRRSRSTFVYAVLAVDGPLPFSNSPSPCLRCAWACCWCIWSMATAPDASQPLAANCNSCVLTWSVLHAGACLEPKHQATHIQPLQRLLPVLSQPASCHVHPPSKPGYMCLWHWLGNNACTHDMLRPPLSLDTLTLAGPRSHTQLRSLALKHRCAMQTTACP